MTTPSQLHQDLIAARALIEKPTHWTKGYYTRDTCFGLAYCTEGACMYAKLEGGTFPVFSALLDQLPAGYLTLVSFNDNSTHAQVLALFDRAIAANP